MSTVDPPPQLAQIEAIVASIERDTRAAAVQAEQRSRRRAVEARAGRMGSDWQQVQRRIDAGETSVEDVFAGRDQTPAARRLVDLSQRNLTELGRLVREDEAVREELAEVDRELSAWDVSGLASGEPVPGDATTGGRGRASEVRSATDPTTGAAPAVGRPVRPDRNESAGGATAAPSPPSGRDPVAGRVDATGLTPDPDTDAEDLDR